MNDVNQQIGALGAHVEDLRQDVADLKDAMVEISAAFHRWKGIAATLLLLGGLAGWVIEHFAALGGGR
jgi:hypothetical protein